MRWRSTYRPSFGPFRVNTGRSGVTSVVFKLGPFTYKIWDKQGRRGMTSVDLPGPLSMRGQGKTPAQREAEKQRERQGKKKNAGVDTVKQKNRYDDVEDM